MQSETQSAALTIEEFMRWSRLGRTKTYSLLNDLSTAE